MLPRHTKRTDTEPLDEGLFVMAQAAVIERVNALTTRVADDTRDESVNRISVSCNFPRQVVKLTTTWYNREIEKITRCSDWRRVDPSFARAVGSGSRSYKCIALRVANGCANRNHCQAALLFVELTELIV